VTDVNGYNTETVAGIYKLWLITYFHFIVRRSASLSLCSSKNTRATIELAK